MAMKRELYPDDWEAISLRIRERAGQRCEWCGLENGALGYRDDTGTFHHVPIEFADAYELDGIRLFKIMLTVAHLGAPKPDGLPGDKRDKQDCRDENLAALCQRCHLNYDRDEHIFNAALTRRRKRIEAGQMELSL
jgi:hypothetical protein